MADQKTLDDIYKFLDDHWPKINKALDVKPYLAELRQKGAKLSAADIRKSSETLLAELHAEAYDDQSRDRAMTVSKTLAKFGSLLVLLSIQADMQTLRIVRLTRALVILTFALLFFTGYLCYDTYIKSLCR
jgi:hypothetical protein